MLNIILITLICLIPIVFWAYIFSSFDNNSFNKKRFIVGLLAWIFSVVPIYFINDISLFFKKIDFFSLSSKINNIFSWINFSFSLILFLIIIWLFALIIWFILTKRFEIIKIFFKNFKIFIFFSFFVGLFFYFLNYFSANLNFLNTEINSQIFFKQTIFNTIKLIIIYYILIAFIEEFSKHFNFLWVSVFDIKKVEDWVLYAIFVALWFSFIENILYLYAIYKNNWFWNSFIQTYFFRSVFSLMLHIFASSVIAYFFSKAYLNFTNNKISYFKTISIWIFLAIFIHFIFNFSLELWFNFIMILFFVIWYLYISSIFYKK